MQLDEIKNWMKNYNFKQLLLWIQTTSVHPNNQLFQIRFEYLGAVLLSINPAEFLEKDLNYQGFKTFLVRYFKKTNDESKMFEDFTPFPQLKLIPYFYNGDKYHFFYGSLERPREFIEKFDWMYLKSDIDAPIQRNLETLFIKSLDFQTGLLNLIASNEESLINVKSLYVPSEDYLNSISQYFHIPDCWEGQCILSGDFNDSISEINKTESINLFNKLAIRDTDGETYFAMPQMHTEILFTMGDELLYSDGNKKRNLESVGKSLIIHLREVCESFFSRFCVLDDIVGINKESLLNDNEVAVKLTDNQIILFHLLRVRHNSVFNMDTGITKVENRISQINSNKFIGFKFPYSSEITLAPPEVLEITGVIVFEYTGITCPPFGTNNLDINFYEFLDLKRMFEHLDWGEEFIRYNREKQFFHKTSRVRKTDELDEFAYFLESGKKFLEGAKIPDFIVFKPHGWHDYYMEFLYEKYKDDIYDITEKLHPYYYNVVIKQQEYIYEIFNKRTLNGGALIKLDNSLVLIEFPLHRLAISNQESVEIGEKLLKPMISEYVVKLQKQYSTLQEQHGFKMREKINIELCPIEEINSSGRLSFLCEHLEKITEDKPFIITTKWNSKKNEKYVFFIYDTNRLHHVFAVRENQGERLFVYELTKSYMEFYCSNYSNTQREQIATEFTEYNVPMVLRRYGMGLSRPRNPRLPDYTDCEKYNPTDVSVINRIVAQHLSKLGFEQGKYEGEEARKINSEIYRFLQDRLEKEITEFNSHLLTYAYQQLEMIEGKREGNKFQYALDSLTNTDFDVIERHAKDKVELSQLSIAVKHLIASILKAGVNSGKAITRLEWQKLLATAIVLNETTMIYELDDYDLVPYSITITDMFEINEDVGSYVFDAKRFQYEESRVSVNNITDQFKSELKFDDDTKDDLKTHLVIPDCVNDSFKVQYGFSFNEMVSVLASLGMMDLERDINFPITVVNKQTLLSEVKIGFPDFSQESIEKILDFLSLSFNTYSKDDELIVSQLMRKKERLNLCPLIMLDDGNLLYGNQMCLTSSSFWVNSIFAGDYPYSINCPDEIKNEMKKIHKQHDRELESKAEKIANEVLGDAYVEARLDKFTRISKELPKHPPCGEIDLIVAIETSKTILVADAKNVNKRVRPYDIKAELNTFFEGDKCYSKKLLKKLQFIDDNLELFLKYFKVKDFKGWKTKPAFIVNHVYSSAFTDSGIEFVLVDDFKDYLKKLAHV